MTSTLRHPRSSRRRHRPSRGPELLHRLSGSAPEPQQLGVLTVAFHTDGGPVTFTGQMHEDFPKLLAHIGDDHDNRVLILTGTGDRFMTDIDGPSLGDITKPANWDKTFTEGRRVLQRLADLEMPIIAAVNGPASVHSEYVLLADIVIAAETTVFSDMPHLGFGIVPGDGIQIVWEEALGSSRSRYLTPSPRAPSPPSKPSSGGPSPKSCRSPVSFPAPRTCRAARRPAGAAHRYLDRRGAPPADLPPDGRGRPPGDGPGGADSRRSRLPDRVSLPLLRRRARLARGHPRGATRSGPRDAVARSWLDRRPGALAPGRSVPRSARRSSSAASAATHADRHGENSCPSGSDGTHCHPPTRCPLWASADAAHLDLLASLDERQWADVRVPYFIGPLTVTEYAGYRLSEAVVHAWDIQASLDPHAKLLPAAQPALLQRIDLVASRFRDATALAELGPAQIAVQLEGGRELTLHLGGELHLWPCSGEAPDGFLDTNTEGLLRLVYGRHPDPISVTGQITEGQLRTLFQASNPKGRAASRSRRNWGVPQPDVRPRI